MTEPEPQPDPSPAAEGAAVKSRASLRWVVPAAGLVVGVLAGVIIGGVSFNGSSQIASLTSTLTTEKETNGVLTDEINSYKSKQADYDKAVADYNSKAAQLDQQLKAEADKHAADFRDGTFLVGHDIQAGVYKETNGSGCYYARLRGTSGTLSDIIANANPSGQAIVTIGSGDVAFESDRCGTWTKIG